MNKHRLKQSYLVQLANGDHLRVEDTLYEGLVLSHVNGDFIPLDDYTDDLRDVNGDRKNDIIKVWSIPKGGHLASTHQVHIRELLWIRKNDQPYLSESEKAILKVLRRDYGWIARDKRGSVYAYERIPKKGLHNAWVTDGGEYVRIEAFEHLFPWLNWYDSEPYNIDEVINNA